MARIFTSALKAAVVVATILSAFLLLAATLFVSGTSTDPLPVDGSDLPKRYLQRDLQSGALSFSFTPMVAGKAPVASFRFGGADFQAVTGWLYLQITSRISTMNSALRSVKQQHHKLRRTFVPNEAALSSFKQLSTKPDMVFDGVSSAENFFYGGYVEGHLGAQDGRMNFPQYSSGKTKYPACQDQYLKDHFAFLKTNYQLAAEGKQTENADFWAQGARIWSQLDGIAAGYNSYAGTNFTAEDVFLASYSTDAMDYYCKYQSKDPKNFEFSPLPVSEPVRQRTLGNRKSLAKADPTNWPNHEPLPGPNNLHCSALVKPTADKQDIFLSHDTWSGWDVQFGYRAYKTYSFGAASAGIRSVSFSGRLDGSVCSGDDWYRTSTGFSGSDKGLAIFETTMEVFNATLYKASKPQLVCEFMRVMIANYLANSSPSWSKYFSTLNLGSYCNSYCSIDYNLFKPGTDYADLPDNLVWVSEQLPTFIEAHDVTDFIRTNHYWPSFNIPAFKKVYDISGNLAMFEKLGNFYSWTNYSRPAIFRRNHTDVVDLASMMRMMRYNNGFEDPLSDIAPQFWAGCKGATNGECTPARTTMFSIASRGDLMTVYPTQEEMVAHYGSADPTMVAQGCFGATDSKIASYSSGPGTNYIINGPTNDQLPTMNWGGACNNKVPSRTPAAFDFPWVQITVADDAEL